MSIKFLPAEIAGEPTDSEQAVMDAADVFESLGRIQAAQFFTTVGERVIAETAIRIKDSKQYKNLPYRDQAGEIRHVGDFKEFCQQFLGKSYTRTMELIGNYHLLGPAVYESAEKIGLRQRDYNALKALPAEDQAIIKDAIEAEDRSRVIDLLQEMAVKHGQEKAALAQEIKDQAAALLKTQDALEAARSFSRERSDEVAHLKEELYGQKLKKPDPDAEAEALRARLSATALEIKRHIMTHMLVGSNQLMAHGEQTGVDHKLFISGLLVEIERECRILRDRHDLPTEPRVSTRPEWMKEEPAA